MKFYKVSFLLLENHLNLLTKADIFTFSFCLYSDFRKLEYRCFLIEGIVSSE